LAAVEIESLVHRYPGRTALAGVSLRIESGEVFGLLGPNGGGKTTLFRLLTTYFPVREGTVFVLGFNAQRDARAIRERIGVVFQSPSLDKKLTVRENLRHQGRLYGLVGARLNARIDAMLAHMGIADRASDLVEALSGGLARRAELAKALLHDPSLLILDEPSAGLDPGGRRDLWLHLSRLKGEGVTILVTTHLMEEAERCDRIGILDQGRLVAVGAPAALRAEIGGDVITLKTDDPEALSATIAASLGLSPRVVDGAVRIEHGDGLAVLAKIAAIAAGKFASIAIAKPTLEDVFIQRTGHRFWGSGNRDE
jgi:ABC-2 type transport system ATP-binding protein